jgi:hypothetical protein
MLEEMKKFNPAKAEQVIAAEHGLLRATASFLNHKMKSKQAELEYLLRKIEQEYSEELEARIHQVHSEICGIDHKMRWEQGQCEKFDEKVRKWERAVQKYQISELSKKILGKQKEN